jgi:hypothetical protein
MANSLAPGQSVSTKRRTGRFLVKLSEALRVLPPSPATPAARAARARAERTLRKGDVQNASVALIELAEAWQTNLEVSVHALGACLAAAAACRNQLGDDSTAGPLIAAALRAGKGLKTLSIPASKARKSG